MSVGIAELLGSVWGDHGVPRASAPAVAAFMIGLRVNPACCAIATTTARHVDPCHSQTYCHATLSVALGEIEHVAVRVGEEGQFEHALVDDRSLEHNATLRERRNHVLDGLINRQPDGDTTCS